MRRLTFLLLAILTFAAASSAQIGKRITIQAGTPEDRAVREITRASDPAQKLALLDAFLAEHAKDDMALVAYELYLEHYLQAQDYAKVYEYGEKSLALDPDGYLTLTRMFRAAQQQGDSARLMDYGLRIGEIIQRFKSRPAPEGTDAAVWEANRKMALEDNQETTNYVAYTVFSTAQQNADLAARAAQLEKFAAAFPDSQYTPNARALVAGTYQQMQQFDKMDAFVEKVLEAEPNNVTLLLMLADSWSERGVQLDKAEKYAGRALEAVDAAPRPESVDEQQWAAQKSIQQGLAHSTVGQVQLHRQRFADGVLSLTKAAPLLKSETLYYARNQLRLGYAYASLRRSDEARKALTEAAEADTPYRARAQEIMKNLPAPAPARRRPRP